MTISGQAKDALIKFGRSGDRSLEYLGVNIFRGGLSDIRIYRKSGSGGIAALNIDPEYERLRDKFSAMLAHPGVVFCDWSQGRLNGSATYRVTFNLPGGLSKEELAPIIADFFSAYPDGDYSQRLDSDHDRFANADEAPCSPLYWIGSEAADTSEGGGLISVKYYLRISGGDKRSPEVLEKLPRLSRALVPGTDPELRLMPEVRILWEHGFRPIFFGVNDVMGKREHKLYFISDVLGYRPKELREQNSLLCREMGWSSVFTEDELDKLSESKLCFRGIALSVDRPEKHRIYLEQMS